MAKQDTGARLSEIAERFAKARDGRTGRSVRAYPDELWREVVALSRAGVAHSELCRLCGFSAGTLSNALGRSMAQIKIRAESEREKRRSVGPGVKSFRVEETAPSPTRTCEVVFPNGVIVRLDVAGLDEGLLGRIRAC